MKRTTTTLTTLFALFVAVGATGCDWQWQLDGSGKATYSANGISEQLRVTASEDLSRTDYLPLSHRTDLSLTLGADLDSKLPFDYIDIRLELGTRLYKTGRHKVQSYSARQVSLQLGAENVVVVMDEAGWKLDGAVVIDKYQHFSADQPPSGGEDAKDEQVDGSYTLRFTDPKGNVTTIKGTFSIFIEMDSWDGLG